MYNDRYGKSLNLCKTPGQLASGIRLHIDTDAIYDAQPEYPAIRTLLTQSMERAGMDHHVARFSSTMAADLILDGALIESPEAIDACRRGKLQSIGSPAMHGYSKALYRFVNSYFGTDKIPTSFKNC